MKIVLFNIATMYII